jgi:hypothetical protein
MYDLICVNGLTGAMAARATPGFSIGWSRDLPVQQVTRLELIINLKAAVDQPIDVRHLDIDGQAYPYLDACFIWADPATTCGLPATAAPIGDRSAHWDADDRTLSRAFSVRFLNQSTRALGASRAKLLRWTSIRRNAL